MLVYLYLGALIFGGVLLGSSILLGGHDDADLDGDLGLDADGDVDIDAHAEADHDLPVTGGRFLWWLRSLRFWTFSLSAFGLTGMLAQAFGLAGPILTLLSALTMGGLSGFTAAWAVKKLSEEDAGRPTGSRDYIGKSAKVLVPIQAQGVGKIRVRVRGQQVDLLAVSDEERLTAEDEVIVIEMDGTRARVARLDGERETN